MLAFIEMFLLSSELLIPHIVTGVLLTAAEQRGRTRSDPDHQQERAGPQRYGQSGAAGQSAAHRLGERGGGGCARLHHPRGRHRTLRGPQQLPPAAAGPRQPTPVHLLQEPVRAGRVLSPQERGSLQHVSLSPSLPPPTSRCNLTTMFSG